MYINIFVCTVNDQPAFSFISSSKIINYRIIYMHRILLSLTHAPTYNHTERNYKRSYIGEGIPKQHSISSL